MPKQYWWIVSQDESGKPYLIFGSAVSESEARQKGLEMLAGMDFTIKQFPTRDLGAASAFLRGKRLEHGEGLRKSSQRIGHEKSLKRDLKKDPRRQTHYFHGEAM